MITFYQWSSLVIVIILVLLSMVFEDSLYSAYMGKMEHNLAHLQSLTANNPHLASSFNQALCQKSEMYQNTLKANKLSADNIVVKSSLLRISISQPTGVHAEVVTSNIIKFALEGTVIGADVLSLVKIAVSCDENIVDVQRTPVLINNRLEYTVILKSILTGAHKLEITATIPKLGEAGSTDSKGKSRSYFASNSSVFFYLDETMDNSEALNLLVVQSSKTILSQEMSLKDMNESEVDRLLTQSVYGERINAVARNKPVIEPAAKGLIRLPGYGFKKGFHIVSPLAEGIIQSDLSIDVAVPIIFVQRSSIRIHLVFDDRYFDITDLMTSNTKMPHLDTHTAFLDLLQRDHDHVLPGDSHNPQQFEMSLLLRPELLQYTGLLNFDLHGVDPGSHQLQLIVTNSDPTSAMGEEVVVSFDSIRLHRH